MTNEELARTIKSRTGTTDTQEMLLNELTNLSEGKKRLFRGPKGVIKVFASTGGEIKMGTDLELLESLGAVEPVQQQAREDKAEQVKELAGYALIKLQERYRVLRYEDGSLGCARIDSPGILVPVAKNAVITDMVDVLLGRATPSSVRADIYQAWQAYSYRTNPVRQNDVVPFVFKSDTTTPWAWRRLGFDPDPSATSPALFQRMLDRAQTPAQADSLVLWTGALLDPEFPRTQYLRMFGSGNDGKGTFIKMLVTLLGTDSAMFLNSGLFASPYFYSDLEGKLLAVFNDENSDGFMRSGKFKGMTGDDFARAERKYEPARTIPLRCRTLIASNYAPQLTGDMADTRRILPVTFRGIPESEVNTSDGTRFVEDGAETMKYCYARYMTWKESNRGRLIPACQRAMNEILATSDRAEADDLLENSFVFGESYKMSAGALRAYVAANRLPRRDVTRLLREHGCVRKQTAEGERVWSGVRLGGINTSD